MVSERGFLCSHQPGKGGKRKEAPDVRESMRYPPALTNMVDTAVIWSKYDVYVHLDVSADPTTIAKELFEHDCITLTKLQGSHKVFGDSLEVTPPRVMLTHPVHLTHEDIALYALRFGGIKAISPGKKGGQSIVTYNSPESAYVACGSKIVIGQAGSILFTSGRSSRDDHYNNLVPQGVCSSLDARVEYCKSFAMLTSASLEALNKEQNLLDPQLPNQPQQHYQQIQPQQPLETDTGIVHMTRNKTR